MLCLVHLRGHLNKDLPDECTRFSIISHHKKREIALSMLFDCILGQNSNLNVKYFHKNKIIDMLVSIFLSKGVIR